MNIEELGNIDFENLTEDIFLIALGYKRYAIVDTEELRRLSRFRWFASSKGKKSFNNQTYAQRYDFGKRIYMHREIVQVDVSQEIDHINGNGLDNRKANLRVCTRRQNSQNLRKRKGTSSRFKGVSWRKDKGKWQARIGNFGKRIFLGYFESESQAAKAYDEKAKELFGVFANLNFPQVAEKKPQAAEKQAKDEKVLCLQGTSNTPWLF